MSWSSIATNGPRFSEILQMAQNSRRNTGRGENTSQTPNLSKQDDSEPRQSASSQESRKNSAGMDYPSKREDTASTKIKEPVRRKSSALSLVQVSTIPEMNTEEEDTTSENKDQNKPDEFPAESSLAGAPLRTKRLPPVRLPHKNTRSLKKKRKKWSRNSGQKRSQSAKESIEMTSQDSSVSQWSTWSSDSANNHKSSRWYLRRQNAVHDQYQQQQQQQHTHNARGEDKIEERPNSEHKNSVSPNKNNDRNSRDVTPVHKGLQARDSIDDFEMDIICPTKSHSLPGKGSELLELSSRSSEMSFSSLTSDVQRSRSCDTGSTQKQGSLEIYYLPKKDPIPFDDQQSNSVSRNDSFNQPKPNSFETYFLPQKHCKNPDAKGNKHRRQSFDDIMPVQEENPAEAPQIRIIRPSTDTIKPSALSGGRRPCILGSGRTKTWAPMTTISSNSDSEYAGRYSTDTCSESNVPLSPFSRQGSTGTCSSFSGVIGGSRWARRRSTLQRRHTALLSSRQFSLASIWSNIPRRHSSNTENAGFVHELSASFVLRRSLLIVGTFLLTNLPLCVFHVCLYWTPPDVIVNVYPLLKLWQQMYMALTPYIYVFSNQKIHMELLKTDNEM